jgi:transcriptional regulator with PAS, ATPase and Fis domain
MRCPACQTEIPPGGPFCSSCGHNILETHQAYLDGLRAFCEGNYEEALRKLKVALLTDPSNPEIIKDCGHAFLHNGDLSSALDMYEKAELLGVLSADADYNRAMALLPSHHWREAHDLLLRIVERKDLVIREGIYYLGLLFTTTEQFLCQCRLHLGICCRELGEADAAAVHFHAALQFNPQSVSAHKHLGDLALARKHFSKATTHYEQVVALSSMGEELLDARNCLGIACYENGRIEEAIQHLNWVLQHDPGNPVAIHNLNHIYEKEGIFRASAGKTESGRFLDTTEGASPIFSLVRDAEAEERARPEELGHLTIIGRSQEMMRMMRHARLAAVSDSTVLITGENGTGKELVARLIYLNSRRADQAFVVVNSAAIPETLLESDLFGHEKGAFTGAVARKIGRFELAHKGTLFLDEIGDLSPLMQVKLLRVLQEREFTRVGGTESVRVDVRILAATNRDLPRMIEEGLFREDLYYRLNVVPIHIPPLRERREDIPLLVEHFIRKYAKYNPKARLKLSEEELAILMDYHWPGNIRELENMIERAIVMGSQPSLYLEELSRLKRLAQHNKSPTRSPKSPVPEPAGEAVKNPRPPDEYPPTLSLIDVEQAHIRRVLRYTRGNQRQAARILGINPSTLWRKLRTHRIEPNEPG